MLRLPSQRTVLLLSGGWMVYSDCFGPLLHPVALVFAICSPPSFAASVSLSLYTESHTSCVLTRCMVI